MRIIKQTIPAEVRYELNRLINGAAMQTDMTARENIPEGNYFIHHDTLYIAIEPIVKGTEIRPGINCMAKSLNDLNGGN